MHVKPYEFIFNNNVARVFQEYVKQFPNVQFCLYGHEHQLTVDDLFGDGILYYQCPNIGKRTYLVLLLKRELMNMIMKQLNFKIVLLFLTIYVCPHRTLAQKRYIII